MSNIPGHPLFVKSLSFLKNIDAMGGKSYIIILIFERREFLWQSGLGLMDLEELVEMFYEQV
jgi:hypothetical protein